MSEFLPPCFSDRCPNWSELDDPHKRLCKSMADILIQQGGAGVLEVTACPFKAMFKLGAEMEDDLILGRIADKLGIVGCFEDDILD